MFAVAVMLLALLGLFQTNEGSSLFLEVDSSGSAALCIPERDRQTGKYIRVIDGDTAEFEIEGVRYRVRYIGVNTPEKGQAYYKEAKEYNERLLQSGEIVLYKDVSETDRYGRLLRYVKAGNVFVNYDLVKNGYAQVMTLPPDVSCSETFLNAQEFAISAKRGLWKE